MKNLFAFCMLIAFPVTANALSLRYDGVDLDGNPLTSVIEVIEAQDNNVISLKITGGGISLDDDGYPFVDTNYFGLAPDTLIRDSAQAWAIFFSPYLYVFTSMIDDGIGTYYLSSLLVFHYDGDSQFELKNIYQSYYETFALDIANEWAIDIPAQPVIYDLAP